MRRKISLRLRYKGLEAVVLFLKLLVFLVLEPGSFILRAGWSRGWGMQARV